MSKTVAVGSTCKILTFSYKIRGGLLFIKCFSAHLIYFLNVIKMRWIYNILYVTAIKLCKRITTEVGKGPHRILIIVISPIENTLVFSNSCLDSKHIF